MRMYEKAILLVALLAANCAFAEEKAKPDYRSYRRFDARLQPVPEDPAIAKSIEVEPLIRALRVKLEPGVEAPDFDLPVLRARENGEGEKTGAIGNDTVRLSSFRGRKPVALTLSGST